MENELILSDTSETEYSNESILYNIYSVSDNSSVFALRSEAINIFDRIVSDLPSYYGYVAYQVSDSEFFLITGSEFSVSGSTLYFGSDCVVSSVSYGEDNESISFNEINAPNTSLSLDSSVLYYTNLVDRYPSLGDPEISFTNFVSLGFILVVLGCVFNRVSRR